MEAEPTCQKDSGCFPVLHPYVASTLRGDNTSPIIRIRNCKRLFQKRFATLVILLYISGVECFRTESWEFNGKQANIQRSTIHGHAKLLNEIVDIAVNNSTLLYPRIPEGWIYNNVH